MSATGTITALRNRVTELEDEVARLKRELSTARGAATAGRRPTTAEAYAARERKPNVERECGGPGRCALARHGANGHPGY